MFLVLFYLEGFVKLSFRSPRLKYPSVIYVIVLLLNMAALPPFPMFFAKFLVLYDYFDSICSSFNILVMFVLANVFMMTSYCQLFMKYITNNYSHSSNYLLF